MRDAEVLHALPELEIQDAAGTIVSQQFDVMLVEERPGIRSRKIDTQRFPNRVPAGSETGRRPHVFSHFEDRITRVERYELLDLAGAGEMRVGDSQLPDGFLITQLAELRAN